MEELRELKDLKEVLTDQIKKISKKGDSISPQELDNAYKAVDIIKDIETICAMKKAEEEYGMEDGYSENRGYSYGTMRMPYFHTYDHSMNRGYDRSYDGHEMEHSRGRWGRDGDGDGRYSEDGYSERRGRDARTGRYTSRDSSYDYSRDAAQDKEQMKRQIQEMQEKLNKM